MANLVTDLNTLQILHEYEYLLVLWASNVQNQSIDYFALETLLQSIADQQDLINSLVVSEDMQAQPKLNSILVKINQQLRFNAQLTVQLQLNDNVEQVTNEP